jgi:hypothetical protein
MKIVIEMTPATEFQMVKMGWLAEAMRVMFSTYLGWHQKNKGTFAIYPSSSD